jgi:hypothetical protein
MQERNYQEGSVDARSAHADDGRREHEAAPPRFGPVPAILAGLLISLSIVSSPRAAVVDCQANRPGAGSVLYLYFPTATDSDFPDDPGGWGVSTSPLEPFDISDLDPGVGTTAELRNAITAGEDRLLRVRRARGADDEW